MRWKKPGLSKTGASRAMHMQENGTDRSVCFEKIEEFRAKGADVAFGAFGENLIVEGYDFKNLPVGTRFRCGKVLLEMTQIGKECHSHCQIYQRMGECIMPHEGVFAVVLEGGTIHVGDELLLQES